MADDCSEKLCEARRDVIQSRLDGMDKALAIKTAEMDRRLEELNKLRQEVVQDRGLYMTKEMYGSAHSSLSNAVEDTRNRINNIGVRVSVVETRIVVWSAAIGMVFAILQVVLHLWKG